MTKIRVIRFGEMRRLLNRLGYEERTLDKGYVFHRSQRDRLIFPLYRETDTLRRGEVASTRRFLDMRGILDETDFDSFFESANQSA